MRAERSEESNLIAGLPPLGDRPRGSPVWSSFVLVDKERPPFGGGPHGSLKGQRMKENTLPFVLQEYLRHIEASRAALFTYG